MLHPISTGTLLVVSLNQQCYTRFNSDVYKYQFRWILGSTPP